MAEQAGAKALANAGVAAADVDLVLVATCTMPTPVPSAAPQLATRLGIAAPGAYDISSGCSGFVYAINAASAAVRAGQARNVLVVASERFSGWLDMTDRGSCIIFGDAAGAAVIGPSEVPGLGPAVWGSDGSQFDSVAIDERTRFFRQDGQAVYRWATGTMGPVALEA
jgi:3-oxoacyl-[acyl-carrier-protein] synthase-3